MNGSDNLENNNLNGWQNIGRVLQWLGSNLTGSDFQLYYEIARRTVGYSQYTSDFTSYSSLSKSTGLSVKTIQRSMSRLIDKSYINKVNTNQIANTGKLPYKYQLNMELEGFPSLGQLKTAREEPIQAKPKPKVDVYYVEDYFLQNGNILILKADANEIQLRRGAEEATKEDLMKYLMPKYFSIDEFEIKECRSEKQKNIM